MDHLLIFLWGLTGKGRIARERRQTTFAVVTCLTIILILGSFNYYDKLSRVAPFSRVPPKQAISH